MCQEFCPQWGVYLSMHWGRHTSLPSACWDTPLGRYPSGQTQTPQADTPWAETPPGRHPQADTLPRQTPPVGKPPCPAHVRIHPPPDSHCSGRYESYWNAFLFKVILETLISMCLIGVHKFKRFNNNVEIILVEEFGQQHYKYSSFSYLSIITNIHVQF